MKRIIFSLIILVFLAMTFQSSSPPGWYAQNIPVNKQINDLQFVDQNTGWIITDRQFPNQDTSFILKTTNGGDNWQIQNFNYLFLSKLFMVDTEVGYIGGGFNGRYLLKTTNGGTSWDTILGTFALGSNIIDISFINRDTGWFIDVNVFDGGLFKTTNGGVSWQRQRNPNETPTLVQFINSNTGWMVYGQQIWKSTNGGNNWFFQVTSGSMIRSLFFLNENKGWAGGRIAGKNPNNIIYTTNGGTSWSNSQGFFGGMSIQFVNDTIGWAGVDMGAHILKSTDGGKNWGKQILPFGSINILSCLPGDTSNAWSYRSHTTDGGGTIIYTGIEIITQNIPSGYELYQNYPNPFNPVTNIRFNIPLKSFTNITITDITGRTVSVLVNEELKPGEYEYTFDAVNLPSGIYFYTLKTEKYNLTKRMILIK